MATRDYILDSKLRPDPLLGSAKFRNYQLVVLDVRPCVHSLLKPVVGLMIIMQIITAGEGSVRKLQGGVKWRVAWFGASSSVTRVRALCEGKVRVGLVQGGVNMTAVGFRVERSVALLYRQGDGRYVARVSVTFMSCLYSPALQRSFKRPSSANVYRKLLTKQVGV